MIHLGDTASAKAWYKCLGLFWTKMQLAKWLQFVRFFRTAHLYDGKIITILIIFYFFLQFNLWLCLYGCATAPAPIFASSGDSNLAELLESARAEERLPALAAAVIINGDIYAPWDAKRIWKNYTASASVVQGRPARMDRSPQRFW